MKTSTQGRALIEQREGKRLRAYRDSRGILTIGVGHTGRMAPPAVTAGMSITEAQCDAFLATDLAPVEHVINTAVTVPLGQNEFDAMTSLGFNIGANGLARSSVVRRLNAGDVAGAAQAFMLWDKPAELVGRRVAERKQFLTVDADHAAVAEARAAVLDHRAAQVATKAKAAATGGTIIAAAGTATIAASAVAHHGFWAWVLGILFAAGAALDGIMTVRHRQTALTLAGNAVAQAGVAAVASPTAPTSAS